MPYLIKKVKGGFVVEDKAGKQFSNKPLTKKVAEKQRIAIALSEHKRQPKNGEGVPPFKSIESFFI
jgi:hypothetical protein